MRARYAPFSRGLLPREPRILRRALCASARDTNRRSVAAVSVLVHGQAVGTLGTGCRDRAAATDATVRSLPPATPATLTPHANFWMERRASKPRRHQVGDPNHWRDGRNALPTPPRDAPEVRCGEGHGARYRAGDRPAEDGGSAAAGPEGAGHDQATAAARGRRATMLVGWLDFDWETLAMKTEGRPEES